jgi:hypothetical protein
MPDVASFERKSPPLVSTVPDYDYGLMIGCGLLIFAFGIAIFQAAIPEPR